MIEVFNSIDINLLFIGETGSGKSTSINTFANVVTYKTLDEARRGRLITLIGTEYSFINDDNEPEIRMAFPDEVETHEYGESSTKVCRPHYFEFDAQKLICIIDTPGIGDTRGKNQDKSNLKNIVNYINTKQNLHAICVVISATQHRLTEHFEDCLMSLLKELHKNALNNLIFICTHSKSIDFNYVRPLMMMKKFFKEAKEKNSNIDFDMNKDKLFCIESDAFNHLLSLRDNNGTINSSFNESWIKTRLEIFKMLKYIFQLLPHDAQETLYLHKTKHLLEQIIEPIVNVIEMNEVNVVLIEKQKNDLKNADNDIGKIKNLMSTPSVELLVQKLSKPQMVCKSEKCRTKNILDDGSKVLFPQVCCHECHWLYHFWSHNNLTFKPFCNKCSCSEDNHHRIYMETTIIHTTKINTELISKITTLENAKLAQQQQIKQYEIDCRKLQSEKVEILKTVARFSVFLKNNLMSSYKDIFVENITQKIGDLKKINYTPQVIIALQNSLSVYEEEQKKLIQSKFNPNAIEMTNLINSLCLLEISGPKIKAIYELILVNFVVKSSNNSKSKVTSFSQWFKRNFTNNNSNFDI